MRPQSYASSVGAVLLGLTLPACGSRAVKPSSAPSSAGQGYWTQESVQATPAPAPPAQPPPASDDLPNIERFDDEVQEDSQDDDDSSSDDVATGDADSTGDEITSTPIAPDREYGINLGTFAVPAPLQAIGFDSVVTIFAARGAVTHPDVRYPDFESIEGTVVVLNQAFGGRARYWPNVYAGVFLEAEVPMVRRWVCLSPREAKIAVEYDIRNQTLRVRGEVTNEVGHVLECLAPRFIQDSSLLKLVADAVTARITANARAWLHVVVSFGEGAGIPCFTLALLTEQQSAAFVLLRRVSDRNSTYLQFESPFDRARCDALGAPALEVF